MSESQPDKRHAPEVTVVIPTRNRAHLVPTSIRTALEQEGVELEVVVVDDASTDETPEAVAAIEDARVRLVRRERQGGPAGGRNTGIAQARGEWIAFLDDDDLWSPRKLRAQLDAASRSEASLVYSAAVLVDERLQVLEFHSAPSAERISSEILAGCAIPAGGSNLLVHSSLLRQVGPFDEHMTHLDDWDMWIRLVLAGRVATCSEVATAYVFHPGNAHMVDADRAQREFTYFTMKQAAAGDGRAEKIDGSEFFRWIASTHRRGGRRWRAARVYLEAAVRFRDPTNLVRAIVVLLGEGVMSRGARRRTGGDPQVDQPDWLAVR